MVRISGASGDATAPDRVQISGRKLTKRIIDALPADAPGGRECFVWDGGAGH
jgi:hypothetical protein